MADEIGCPCEVCGRKSRWSILNLEGLHMQPVTRWFACGRHLHRVLDQTRWGGWAVDTVQIMDLADMELEW